MVLFKRIEIDIEGERKRVNRPRVYNARQRKALNTLIDLFEKGEFQKCLNHVNSKKAFPYNKTQEYDEKEHIGTEISHILHGVAYDNYYTRDELLKHAKEVLDKERAT